MDKFSQQLRIPSISDRPPFPKGFRKTRRKGYKNELRGEDQNEWEVSAADKHTAVVINIGPNFMFLKFLRFAQNSQSVLVG